MDRIEVIREMESKKNQAREMLEAMNDLFNQYEETKKDLKILSDYYDSMEYFADVDRDQAGEFPEDLARGVLSEDELYDLFGEHYYLGVRMVELGIQAIKGE